METITTLVTDDCDALVTKQKKCFTDDYAQHAVVPISKPMSIGMPFLLRQPAKLGSSTTGVLLVHGLMAAPEEVAQWAAHLYEQGFTVYSVRLAGHGTTAIDLASRTHHEWLESVNQGQAILESCCEEIIIAGFSTGAALALLKAIEQPQKFKAVVSISAPMKMASFSANFAGLVNRWNNLLATFNINKFTKRFATNHPDNPDINYPLCPVSSIVEIQTMMRKVKKGLSSLKLPVLVIHADKDPKVHINSAKVIFEKLGSKHKYYKVISFNKHGIVRGEISKQVFSEVDNFFADVLTKSDA